MCSLAPILRPAHRRLFTDPRSNHGESRRAAEACQGTRRSSKGLLGEILVLAPRALHFGLSAAWLGMIRQDAPSLTWQPGAIKRAALPDTTFPEFTPLAHVTST